jgi:membrane fusion protein, heavy metal efflux system
MKNIFIISIATSFLFACDKTPKKTETQTTFVLSQKMLETTKTQAVELQNLRNELNFYGKITADNNKMIEVYPVVGGNVTKVFVELGDYVKRGQLLATIRSTEVASFEKELDDAKNDLLVAKNNLKVAQELFEGKLNAEREVIEAKSQLDKAKSQLHRIEETYSIYNIKQGAVYEVRSPLSGFVIQKNINQDMLLRNDRTDNIFDIAEIDDVWAIANVNESDIDQVKLGIDAEVTTLSYHDKIFHGKVDKIFNIIDPETKAMKVRIKLSNADYLLKPEMRANIKLSYTEGQKMLAIPSESVIFDKSKHYVMIFKDKNNIETRQVEVFRQVGNTTYILSGLKEGEKVMTANQLLVYDELND